MSRWLFMLAVLPICTGCLGYGYPTLVYTPNVPIEKNDGSIHAFRVDVDKTDRKPLTQVTHYTLAKIPLDSRGVPSQLEVAFASGVYKPLEGNDAVKHERNDFTMLVRLYRPGYRTITVQAWDKSRELHWQAAPDLLAQEKAIDDLLAVPAFADQLTKATWWELKDEKMPVRPSFDFATPMTVEKAPVLGLQPGSTSPTERRALEFASSEYDRLARSPAASSPSVQTHRERLQQKAIWLKRFADQ
ncbi:MAG: hypothetical protein HY289_05260 [Planctomycetes bacterium]|nr:hypothetical protein [Planctomycetota bacterium]